MWWEQERTFSEEELRAIGMCVLVRHEVKSFRKNRGAAEKLYEGYQYHKW